MDDYVVNSDEIFLRVVVRVEGLKRANIENKEDYKKRILREKMKEIQGLKLHEQFGRDSDDKNRGAG